MSDLSKRTSVESLWAYSLYIRTEKRLIHLKGQSGFFGDTLIVEQQISNSFAWTIEFIFFLKWPPENSFKNSLHNNRKLHEMKVYGTHDKKVCEMNKL